MKLVYVKSGSISNQQKTIKNRLTNPLIQSPLQHDILI
jgi:hypothetical protein